MGSSIEVIKLSEIMPSGMQLKSREESYSQDKLQQLVSGYEKGRYIPPIRIRRSNGSYQCISGHIRLKAMMAAGFEEVKADDQMITLAEDMGDAEADMETLLENHSREDLRWWEKGIQWKRFREKHDISQKQLADKLPDVSPDKLKHIEYASRLAEDPDLVIRITKMDLGYNAAEDVLRIPGGPREWELFLDAAEKLDLTTRQIDSYTKQLKRTKESPELLEDLLTRMFNEKLPVDRVMAAIDEQLGDDQSDVIQVDDEGDADSQVSEGNQTENADQDSPAEPGEGQKGEQEEIQDSSSETDAEEDVQPSQAGTDTDDAPPSEQDIPAGEIEAATYDTSQRARERIEMLRQFTTELPDLKKRLDEDADKAEMADEMFAIIKGFIRVAVESYSLSIDGLLAV